MAIEISRLRKYIQAFDFKALFIEELGWDRLPGQPTRLAIDDAHYTLQPIAEKRGFQIWHCVPHGDGMIPEQGMRQKLDREMAKRAFEHLIIFTDAQQSAQTWQWGRREAGRPLALRQDTFTKGQSGDRLAQKLAALAFDLEDEERGISLVDVNARVRASFDTDRVTKRFYDRFKKEHDAFLHFIQGITEQGDREWYASLMLNRLMFVYFIQKKGFLDGDLNYLRNRMRLLRQRRGSDRFFSFYRHFLLRLFHEGLGQQARNSELDVLLGAVPYLNGGLFDVHVLERDYAEIQIADDAFEKIFDFFDAYQWHLDERPLRADNEINPDVLGYIFEKYINQKQMGAYYTKEDITEYISKNTIIPFLFDAAKKKVPIAFARDSALWRILREDPDRYIYDALLKGLEFDLPAEIAVGIEDVSKRGNWNKPADSDYALATETWREHVARRRRVEEIRARLQVGEVHDINDMITHNLDIRQFAQDAIQWSEGPDLLRAFYQAITEAAILDPTCGSGAFLFAALNILEPLHEECLDRMQGWVDDLDRSGERHGPTKFADFRTTLERVAQHPNRRYFILKSIILNNLYGVDIMEEAVEICKLRLFLKLVAQLDNAEQVEPLPDIDFNIRAGNTLIGFATYDDVKRSIERKFDFERAAETIDESAKLADRAFQDFRRMQTEVGLDAKDFVAVKRELRERLKPLEDELNKYLALEYGIFAEKQNEFTKWRESHQPFHWFVEFYGIIGRGGFDVIIGNPPYVEYSKIRPRYTIQDLKTEDCGDLYAFVMERSTRLLNKVGTFGMIVPVSIVSTDGFDSLRKTMMRGDRTAWILNFAERPSKLFTGVEKRLTIWLTRQPGIHVRTFLSSYRRWLTTERDALFDLTSFVGWDGSPSLVNTAIPKVATPIELAILERLSQSPRLDTFFVKRSPYLVHYTRKLRYFVQFFDFIPKISDADGKTLEPSELKELRFNSARHRDIALAVLNSSFFFWFFSAYSDVRNVNRREIEAFRCALDSVDDTVAAELERLAGCLMEDYDQHSRYLTNDYGKYGVLTIQSFQPRLSKPIIDDIDRSLALHYGLTAEEIDFIINYDVKYRLGQLSEDIEE